MPEVPSIVFESGLSGNSVFRRGHGGANIIGWRRCWWRAGREFRSRRHSKQLHLLDLGMHATTAALMLVPNAILSPKRRHQLRQALPKSLWQKCPLSITRPVKLHQLREILFEKRQEHSRRARLEENRIGKDPLRARFARGFYQSLKVAWPIRDLRQHRCAHYARVDARKIQLRN